MLIYLDPNSFIDEGIESYTKKLYIIYTYMNIKKITSEIKVAVPRKTLQTLLGARSGWVALFPLD